MKKILFLSLILILISCKKNDNPDVEGWIHPINRIDLSYVDNNGTDLLKQENLNAINQSSIKLYYLQSGEKQFQNITFFNDETLRFFRFYTNVETLFLEFNDQVTDTIKCELISDGSNLTRKIWYNGVLISDAVAGTEFHFTIVK